MNNQIISVMGCSGSGKTTTCIRLAHEISKHKKNVVVVSFSYAPPLIPYVLEEYEDMESIGALLTKMQLTRNDVLQAMVPVKGNDYISLLGYKLKEQANTYPKVVSGKLIELFMHLRSLVDVVIVDIESILDRDVLSVTALEMSDKVIKLVTPSLKGLMYYQSIETIIQGKIPTEKDVNMISKLRSKDEWEIFATIYGGVQYRLPYEKEIKDKFHTLRLFEEFEMEDTKGYVDEIEKVVKDLFLLETQEPKKQRKEKDKKVTKEEHLPEECSPEERTKKERPRKEKKEPKKFRIGKKKEEF